MIKLVPPLNRSPVLIDNVYRFQVLTLLLLLGTGLLLDSSITEKILNGGVELVVCDYSLGWL